MRGCAGSRPPSITLATNESAGSPRPARERAVWQRSRGIRSKRPQRVRPRRFRRPFRDARRLACSRTGRKQGKERKDNDAHGVAESGGGVEAACHVQRIRITRGESKNTPVAHRRTPVSRVRSSAARQGPGCCTEDGALAATSAASARHRRAATPRIAADGDPGACTSARPALAASAGQRSCAGAWCTPRGPPRQAVDQPEQALAFGLQLPLIRNHEVRRRRRVPELAALSASCAAGGGESMRCLKAYPGSDLPQPRKRHVT